MSYRLHANLQDEIESLYTSPNPNVDPLTAIRRFKKLVFEDLGITDHPLRGELFRMAMDSTTTYIETYRRLKELVHNRDLSNLADLTPVSTIRN